MRRLLFGMPLSDFTSFSSTNWLYCARRTGSLPPDSLYSKVCFGAAHSEVSANFVSATCQLPPSLQNLQSVGHVWLLGVPPSDLRFRPDGNVSSLTPLKVDCPEASCQSRHGTRCAAEKLAHCTGNSAGAVPFPNRCSARVYPQGSGEQRGAVRK